MDFDKHFFDHERGNNYRQDKLFEDREYHEENKKYLSYKQDNCWCDENKDGVKAKSHSWEAKKAPQYPVDDFYWHDDNCRCDNDCNEDIDEGFDDSCIDNCHDICNDSYNCDEDCDCDCDCDDDNSCGDCGCDDDNSYGDCGCDDDNSYGDCGCDDDNSYGDCGCDDDNSCGDCGGNDLQPTSDSCSGCMHNRDGDYFRGQGELLAFGRDKLAYYILKNPENSNVNVFIDTCDYSNLCSNSMKINIYYCGTKTSNLLQSDKLVVGNSNFCENISYNAQVYYGNKKVLSNGICASTLCIAPFSSFSTTLAGKVLLSPGYTYMVEIAGLPENESGRCIASFAWWEETII